jgi:LmbE family N-acetylglucosaminyl deacetylase
MNPYRSFVSEFARLVADGKSLPLGEVVPREKPKPAPDAPVALIFSPHPDDECIIGALPLRLLRESGMRIVNVAVTLGSDRSRQQSRLQELKNACDWIGFDLELPAPDGLEKITPATRAQAPQIWTDAVHAIAVVLARYQPHVIFFPHVHDWHQAHIGTHLLVTDALKAQAARFQCHMVETEYWRQMESPNLLVESTVDDVADLVAALSFHAGEVRRNPYHLRLPAWMQDNVRRGAEWLGGQGGVAPDFLFATLYRIRRWHNGKANEWFKGVGHISAVDFPGDFFR